MQLQTYGDARTQIEEDLDIQGEDAVTDSMMRSFFNSAIGEAESTIHAMYEGYFRKWAYLDLTQDDDEVDMPSDIYAFKIVKMFWVDAARKYEIVRLKLEEQVMAQAGDDYGYDLESGTAGAGAVIKFYPAPRETTATKARVAYIRSANRVSDDSDVIDIPEFAEYVRMHVKVNCSVIIGHPLLGFFTSERERLKEEMVKSLKAMVLDGASNIEADPSFYDDMA